MLQHYHFPLILGMLGLGIRLGQKFQKGMLLQIHFTWQNHGDRTGTQPLGQSKTSQVNSEVM